MVAELAGVDAKAMQEAALKLQGSLGPRGAVVLASRDEAKVTFVAAFGPEVRRQAGRP